jgi:serine/threonine protein kinase
MWDQALSLLHVACRRFIASGAFGDVFLARWHGTEVAVKCLSSNLLVGSGEEGGSSAAGSAAAADLMQEASMLAALHHPNIVAVYGFVPPPQDMLGRCSFELPARPMRTVSAAAACHAAMEVSGPAIVSEYMAAGSLHSALQNQAEWLKSSMAKVKVLLDTARVRLGARQDTETMRQRSACFVRDMPCDGCLTLSCFSPLRGSHCPPTLLQLCLHVSVACRACRTCTARQ